jgi:Ca2+-dependent lipid-binding protein
LTLFEARGLSPKDITGTNDPYCKISLKHDIVIFKSSVKKRVYHPSWEESFPLLIYDTEHDMIHIRVFDCNTMMPDELIGECSIPFSEVNDSMESCYER